MSNKELEKEILTRLLHAHPEGLGKEVLDNFRGEKVVAGALKLLQDKGWIQGGTVSIEGHEPSVTYPVKLTASGVDAAKECESRKD
ncbi:hypothetical protein [Pseudomonas fluorescens]|uniref:ArsR family transcriptional regulator n=1 Tax=Pseudomonas fluorescens TaxID=294 RepID=A0A5E7ELD2_PSEFL|nr:hypothetical protein [Pseudomonas fluorescens]VVO27117.1 hypothetical protein PS723_04690 [Pseudomonas fluorescens]